VFFLIGFMSPGDVGERTVGTDNTNKTIPSRLCTYLVFILLRRFFYMIMLLFGGQSEIQSMLFWYIFIMSTLNLFNKFSGFIAPTFFSV
jgi:hypothetical protein